MEGLTITVTNILTRYKAGVAIKKQDVIQQLKYAAAEASTEENPVDPGITLLMWYRTKSYGRLTRYIT